MSTTGRQLGTEAMAGDQTGLLIVRAWVEPGSTEPLRARVRVSADVSSGIQSTQTFCRADEVYATVREWLTDFTSRQVEPEPPPRAPARP